MNNPIRVLNEQELNIIAGGVGIGGGGRSFADMGNGDSSIGIGGGGRDWFDGFGWFGGWVIPPIGDDPVIPVPKPDPGKP